MLFDFIIFLNEKIYIQIALIFILIKDLLLIQRECKNNN